jgi:hypothetical protein
MTTVTDTTTGPAMPEHHRTVPRWALPAATGLLGLCLGIPLGAQYLGGHPAAAATSTAAAPAPAPAPAPASASAYTPTATDFTLSVDIKKQECFDTAGCAVTYQVAVAYNGLTLDPGTTYEVTYEVEGLAQPALNTFTVTGDNASVPKDETGQTEGPASLTAVVTAVRPS